MKTKNILHLTAIFLIAGQFKIYANETTALANAQADLVKDVQKLVQRAPFELLYDDQTENKISIEFVVNETGELTELQVEGKNESLVHWINMKIKNASITANSILSGQKCHIPVTYKML
jgi:hypothetical protein